MNTKIRKMMFLAVLLLSFVIVPSSYAALNAVGPVDPVTTIPAWYQDSTGLSLAPCFDNNGFCGVTMAAGPGFDPTLPVVFPGNFPEEGFYFIAIADAGTVSWEGAIEFALFPAPPLPPQNTFSRIRIRDIAAPDGTYTVTHPYGVDTITVAGGGINLTRDIGAVPGDFNVALVGDVGPYLRPTTGFVTNLADGKVYIGNGVTPTTVIGTAVTSVTVAGPINATTNLFTLEGKVTGLTASPAAVTFPAQKPGTTSAIIVTISNPDTLNLAALGAGAITGTNAALFTLGPDTCSNNPNIPASGTCTVTVNFSEPAPGLFGTKSAVVSFPVTTPLNKPPLVVNLAGSIDNQPPDVVTTTPGNGAPNVPANNAITATFSETVTGVSSTTFTLTSGGAPVAGAVTYNAASNTAVFTPAANLTVGGNFTATLVAAGITDLAGNALLADTVISFTTTLPDTTPPAVVSVTPANNTLGVPTSSVITVKFNEPVDPATVNASTITVSTPSGAVAGAVTYDPATLTAKFTPSPALAGNQLHTVTVTTGVKSLGGVPMAAAFTSTFATNAAPTKPVLISPAANQTGVGTTVDFQWIKSTDSDAGDTVTYKLFYCTNQFMVNCNPVTVAQSASPHGALAGLGGYGAGILLAGVFFAGGVKSRRRLFLFLAVLLISGMVATACSKSSDEPAGPAGPGGQVIDPATLVTKNVTGLTPATTYYWKVVADDGHGGLTESETTSFTTQ